MSCSFCLRLSRENEIRWTCPSPWILRIISQSKYSLRRVTGRAGTLCERSSVYRLQRGTVVVVLVKHLEANLLYYDPVAACLSKMHSCTCDLRNLNWCRIFNRISTVIVSHCVCFPTGPSCQDRSAGSYQSHGGHRGKGSLPHYSQSVPVSSCVVFEATLSPAQKESLFISILFRHPFYAPPVLYLECQLLKCILSCSNSLSNTINTKHYLCHRMNYLTTVWWRNEGNSANEPLRAGWSDGWQTALHSI